MKPRFSNISIKNNRSGFNGIDNGTNFSANFDLFIIREAWDRGVDFEDLADGYGKGLGTMGGDWSGIRDSSNDAINEMLERSLNFLFKLTY